MMGRRLAPIPLLATTSKKARKLQTVAALAEVNIFNCFPSSLCILLASSSKPWVRMRASSRSHVRCQVRFPGVNMKNLRILIADDHDLMRRGVRSLLVSHPGWEVCGEATTGREAVTKAEEMKPDIVVLDISMPDLNGLEAARRIRKASANTEILILSMHYSDQLIRDILEAGVRGYIVKSDSDRDLIIAVETLATHKPFFTPRATEVILSNFQTGGVRPTELPESVRDRLTSREREIVQLLAEGKSSKEVAASLNISVKTAETHRANIMRKLQLHTVSELVRYAVRNQIIEP
jgi:DNA-binding NarL/FixJ family response regulator